MELGGCRQYTKDVSICELCGFLVKVTMPVQPHLLWVCSVGENLFQVESGSTDVYGVSCAAVNEASHEDLLTCNEMAETFCSFQRPHLPFTRCNIYLLLFNDAVNC